MLPEAKPFPQLNPITDWCPKRQCCPLRGKNLVYIQKIWLDSLLEGEMCYGEKVKITIMRDS